MTLNIVVPMAGRGSRFADAGFAAPKPLIMVGGQVPMIQLVIQNLRPAKRPARFIFLCLAEHLERWPLADRLIEWAGPDTEIVAVNQVTDGAASTVLLARDLFDGDQPLMIANCDQYVQCDMDEYLDVQESAKLDGLIMTMTADHPKWSYLRFDDQGSISEVVEKQVVSNEATVGIYNFARGRDFVEGAEEMIAADLRVNGEFYVAPVYNRLIEAGARLGWMNIGTDGDGMHGLGVPDDLRRFEVSPIAQVALARASGPSIVTTDRRPYET